jgi:hypothetical protein
MFSFFTNAWRAMLAQGRGGAAVRCGGCLLEAKGQALKK